MKRSSVANSIFTGIFICALLLGGLVPQPVAASPSAQGQDNGVRYGYSETTGKLTFVGAPAGQPIDVAGVSGVSALGPEAQAMGLVAQYASAFGLSHPARELQVKSQENSAERSTVKYQQVYQGIPVMGGELVVNTTGDGYLTSMNGEVSPDLAIDTTPKISAEEAQSIALGFMQKWYPDEQVEFQASQPEQWIYDSRLLEDKDGPVVLGWRMEVTAKDMTLPIRELVLVDAETGNVPLHFNQIDTEWQMQDPAPTGPPAATDTPVDTTTPTRTPSVTDTETPSDTIAPTNTAAPTETPVITDAPTPTDTPTFELTATPTEEITLTLTETPGGTAEGAEGIGALSGTPRYVATTGTNTGNCSNLATPCATINFAIGQAVSGDTVYVAVGTYAGTGTQVVLINKSLSISGGWNASFTSQNSISTIDGGEARRGVAVTSGYTVIIDHFFITNGASSGSAGGLSNDPGSTLTLNNSVVSGNVAQYWAGISNGGTLTLNHSAVSENTASNGDVGGIHSSGTLTLNYSTVGGNVAHYGAGIYNRNATMTVNNSTISGNRATNSSGGGIYNYGTLTLKNSIVANNSAGSAPDCYGSLSSAGHNIIGNTSGCSVTAAAGDLFNVDPQTSAYPVGVGYYALKSSSAAIDAGDPATCLSTDQRGMARPQGAACDIGAYEYTTPGAAASIGVANGSNQRALPNQQFPQPLVVYVLDAGGSSVGGVSVTFQAPGSGASGTFSGSETNMTPVLTDGWGVGQTNFVANGQLGTYSVSATVQGLGASAIFTVTNGAWYVSPAGSDANTCAASDAPCATINAAMGKAAPGETIFVAVGRYTGSGAEVVTIQKSITLSGGWAADFAFQIGKSTIDGQNLRRGITISGVAANLDALIIENGFHSIQGGGIYNTGALYLNNSTVRRNSAHIWGGGIYDQGTLTITNTTISDNRAGGIRSSGEGGGIYHGTGALLLVNSRISGNGIVDYGVGSGITSGGTMTALKDTAVYGNLKTASLVFMGNTVLENTTISGNDSGGIYVQGAALSVNNSTISGNLFGISRNGTYPGVVSLENTILANNTSSDCSGSVTSFGHNLIGGTSGCTFLATEGDQLNVDPDLGQFIGSPGYLPLHLGSPAIDAGNSSTCLVTDERGLSRPQDSACDIGAYEYVTPGPAAKIGAASGGGQQANLLIPFSEPLAAYVVDNLGSPAAGVTVVFEAPADGPSGIFGDTGTPGTTAVSDSDGIARTMTITANGQAGDYMVAGTSSGLDGTALFALKNRPPWYVSPSGNDSNSCSSPDSPCLTVNAAIAKASSGDPIRLREGTYTGSGTDPVLTLSKNVQILGGWDPSFTAQTSQSWIDGQNARSEVWVSYGGIVASLSNLAIVNGSGYGIYNTTGNITVTNTTVSNNRSRGIYNGSGIMLLENVTISGNSVTTYYGASGGGIYNESGTMIISNSTIARNSSTETSGNTYSYGGGITNSEGTITIKNTLIANNTATYGPDCRGEFISEGHNLIRTVGTYDPYNVNGFPCLANWAGTDRVGYVYNGVDYRVDPHLGPLQDAGGGVMMHRPLPGSPAIDWIDPASCDVATDQRGVSRPQGSACDIGAYELEIERSDALILKTYNSGHTWDLRRSLVCDQSDLGCTAGDQPEKKAHEYAYDTYDFYKTRFGRDSINGSGMAIISNVHAGSNYGNAYWLTQEMVYGDKYGFALADDVVGHELTHGVTQFSSGLLYWYQSGAINESLSDIFGEAVDQTNGAGNDSDAVRWKLGEDVSGLGALRSLANPPAFGDPDKMTSSLYRKTSDDNGGVHHNSGVGNKAAYLMVQGGTFNNKTVTALGWDKTLAIYYEANTNLLTSGSDYADLYNVLYQACVNLSLIGTNEISLTDCQEVRDATNAVQMNSQPAANFNPDASLCPSGYKPYTVYFQDDLESGSGKWTFAARLGQSAWEIRSGYGHSGDNALWGDDGYTLSDSVASLSQRVALPAGVQIYLHFDHAFSFDTASGHYYDGGVLEYSTNGGSTWIDAKPLFNAGKSYGGTVINWAHASALKNRPAFVGDSHGYVESRYKLSSLAGKSVLFRWRMATDAYGYMLGWYVDDVQIYRCLGIPSKPTLLKPANGSLSYDYTPLLDWSDSTPDLDHYQLQVATTNTFTSRLIDQTITKAAGSTFTPTSGLAPATTFFWRVRAFNVDGGTKGWSAVWSFRTAVTAPVPSEPASGSTPLSLRPRLDWNDVPSKSNYTLQVSQYSDLSSPIINTTVSASAYTPTTDLPAGSKLYWRVRANNGSYGPSAWTKRSFFTPKPPSKPNPLQPANGSLTSDTTPPFDWSTSSLPTGATFDHYQLRVATDSGFSAIVIDENIASLTGSEFTPVSELSPNTKYYWHVRSFNTLGQFSSWSSTFNFRAAMLPPALTAPTNGEIITDITPLLDWEQVDGASGYTVQVSTGSNFSTFLVNASVSGGVTTQYQLATVLPANQTLYWRVRANGPNGPSPWTTQTFTLQ